MLYLGGQRGVFPKVHLETSDMTSEVLGEMIEGDSADTCAGKFPLMDWRERKYILLNQYSPEVGKLRF